MSSARDQPSDAQKLYDERSEGYDASWHPRFARHVVEIAQLQHGDAILDLACGTGLVTYAASTAVGSIGRVIGVDISSGMLSQAKAKKAEHHLNNVEFYQHSIADLDTLTAIKNQKFDVIICASALVLLEHPDQALRHWTTFLKEGGRMLVDVTHPRSQLPQITFERVGRALGHPVPWYRLAFQSPNDLQAIMEAAGLQHVKVLLVSQLDIEGTDNLDDYLCSMSNPKACRVRGVEEANEVFDQYIDTWSMEGLNDTEVKTAARQSFVEEWARLADANGRIEVIDGVYLGIGIKG